MAGDANIVEVQGISKSIISGHEVFEVAIRKKTSSPFAINAISRSIFELMRKGSRSSPDIECKRDRNEQPAAFRLAWREKNSTQDISSHADHLLGDGGSRGESRRLDANKVDHLGELRVALDDEIDDAAVQSV
jgi:hypothetical protein